MVFRNTLLCSTINSKTSFLDNFRRFHRSNAFSASVQLRNTIHDEAIARIRSLYYDYSNYSLTPQQQILVCTPCTDL